MKINGEQLGFNFIKDNAVLYNSINCPRERLTLYHYCDFESFLEIISKRTIKFNRIDKVNDKKENEEFGNLEIAKLVFISCFSINKEESIPLWHIYTTNNWGIRICFRLKEPSFCEKFVDSQKLVQGPKYYDGNNDTFKLYNASSEEEPTNKNWVIDILQKDIIYDINQLKETPIYNGYIFDMYAMGAIKDKAWRYEDETRLVATMRTVENEIEIPEYECLFVPVDFSALDSLEIKFGPWMTDAMKQCVKDATERYIPEIKVSYEDSDFNGVISRK